MSRFREKMFDALFLTGAAAFVGAVLSTLVAKFPLPSPAMMFFFSYLALCALGMVAIGLADLWKRN